MRRFFNLSVAVCMTLTAMNSWAQKTAYGYTMYPATSPAMISFDINAPSTTTSMGTYAKAEPRSGAAVKGKLYMMGVDDDFNTWFYCMDMSTGASETIKKLGDVTVPMDMSYDYSTEVMYSIANSETDDGVSALSTIDLTTGALNTVTNNLGFMCRAIAIDARGQMYLLDRNGVLHKANKSNGASEVIGSTGVQLASWFGFNSMEFDRETGELYLAAWTLDEQSKLYKIDPATAASTLVGAIGGGTHTTALSIPYEPADGSAPERVTDVTLVADSHGALNAVLSWTNPVRDYNGYPLSGALTIEVTIAGTGEKMVIENCQPGQTMQRTIEVSQAGMCAIAITAVNQAGASLEQTVEAWIGHDVPAAPANARAVLNAFQLLVNDLTWEVPAIGAHGGYLDPSSITYDIVRVNDGKAIIQGLTETSYSDTELLAELTRYSYKIIARNADGTGEPALTNDLVNGPAMACPYVAPFNSWDESGQFWTVLDANGDGYPFVWYNDYMNMFGQGYNKGYYIYQTNESFYANDFIVSPPINFTEGHEYKITATVSNDDIAGYREESFRFYTLAGYSLDGAIPLGDEAFTVKHPGEFRDYSFSFLVEDDGNGREGETFPSFIALCCNSHYDMGMLLVSQIAIEDITPVVTLGDMNNDGNVDVVDATMMINSVLKNLPLDKAVADINGDGNVDVSDVSMLINNILGK